MSLQTRIVALLAAVLLISTALGAVFAGVQSRRALNAEIQAAMLGGAQTVRTAFEDLPRSDHQTRDLAQLVATFDGNRHVAAALVDARGVATLASHAPQADRQAPGWFKRLIAPTAAPVALPTPKAAHVRASIVLSAVPDADLGVLWAELSGVVTLLVVSAAAGLVLVALMVRAALSPLRELATGLAKIGLGDYRGRVRERGPVEILSLERSFNDMAESLAAMRKRTWALEQQLLTLQDEERAEIARDLHDDVGAHLFAVSLDAQVITELLANGRTDGVRDQIEAIHAGVGYVQREIRAMVARLRPARATELGLQQAVQDLVKFWGARRPEIAFQIVLPPAEAGFSDAVKDTTFRVVQEAVNNAVRHAHPDRIDIAVHREANFLNVRVLNDGALDEPPRDAARFGLLGMRERVEAAGGDLTVQPAQEGDWTWSVSARLPTSSSAVFATGRIEA